MRMQEATAARQTSVRAPAPIPTRAELIKACIAALTAKSEKRFYDVIHDVEGLAKQGRLADTPIAGTIFEPMLDAMRKLDPSIKKNLTGFQDAFGATDENVHDLACYCLEESEVMTGLQGINRMTLFAQGLLGAYRSRDGWSN